MLSDCHSRSVTNTGHCRKDLLLLVNITCENTRRRDGQHDSRGGPRPFVIVDEFHHLKIEK